MSTRASLAAGVIAKTIFLTINVRFVSALVSTPNFTLRRIGLSSVCVHARCSTNLQHTAKRNNISNAGVGVLTTFPHALRLCQNYWMSGLPYVDKIVKRGEPRNTTIGHQTGGDAFPILYTVNRLHYIRGCTRPQARHTHFIQQAPCDTINVQNKRINNITKIKSKISGVRSETSHNMLLQQQKINKKISKAVTSPNDSIVKARTRPIIECFKLTRQPKCIRSAQRVQPPIARITITYYPAETAFAAAVPTTITEQTAGAGG
eukprot:TRINITY_DN859_c0_g1_i2.p2 TRINITY_DN859_c0_g1~~TRINITY_DN859_c0_g1_i2.p2  ORF type:complete len:262 (-),score=-20.65 TRINITY_DN859_c0_g1_i2:1043-1828(-)